MHCLSFRGVYYTSVSDLFPFLSTSRALKIVTSWRTMVRLFVLDFWCVVLHEDNDHLIQKNCIYSNILSTTITGKKIVRFPASPLEFSEIGYLLLPSRDMAEIPLKRRKSSIQPTNQPTNVFHGPAPSIGEFEKKMLYFLGCLYLPSAANYKG